MKKLLKTFAAASLSLSLVACGGSQGGESSTTEDKTIKVGATLVPHAEILKDVVKPVLEADGWTLEVVEFNDYVTPNTALEEGELDANYFQTLGYMKDQNENGGLHLVASVGVHIEPMGIYSKKLTSLDDLAEGAKVGVPNDDDNYNRAIELLVAKGYLNGTGTEDELNGNADANPKGLVITPTNAENLPRALDDLDFAVINGNYALEADLPSSSPALEIEEFDAETSVRRTNYIVVKEGNEDSEKIQALVRAITSDEVKAYIEDTYKGAVIPSFIDADGNEVK